MPASAPTLPTPRASDAVVLRVAEFTTTPGPRHPHEGQFSGEQFRENYLVPGFNEARSRGVSLLVDMGGTEGYASSFLEEAFGGLARRYSAAEVLAVLHVKSEARPWYIEEVLEEYVPEANDR